jgi:hypothetical protein
VEVRVELVRSEGVGVGVGVGGILVMHLAKEDRSI